MVESSYRPRSPEKTIVVPAQSSLYGGGSEDMTRAPKPDRAPARQWPILFEGNRCQVHKRRRCILFGVEGQGRLVFGKAVAVRVFGVLLL